MVDADDRLASLSCEASAEGHRSGGAAAGPTSRSCAIDQGRKSLVGYENRVLAKEDFEDDKKDSGDLGAGHNVTAFYELALTDAAKGGQLTSAELALVKLRYKQPNAEQSELLERSLTTGALAASFDAAPANLRYAAATAEYAEIMRHSKHSSGARFDDVLGILRATAGADANKQQLIGLVEDAKRVWR